MNINLDDARSYLSGLIYDAQRVPVGATIEGDDLQAVMLSDIEGLAETLGVTVDIPDAEKDLTAGVVIPNATAEKLHQLAYSLSAVSETIGGVSNG